MYTMAMNTFHCQWIAPSINYVTNYQYTMHCHMLMGLLLLRLVSQACQMSVHMCLGMNVTSQLVQAATLAFL